jgi:type I restriction-modification system DNA methylase subunit
VVSLAQQKERQGVEGKQLRDRSGQTLFIDARKFGFMADRTHRDLSDEDVQKITGAYHAWCGDGGEYQDVLGFCKAASLEHIESHGYVLTPGRYVGVEAQEEDSEPFVEKMARLTKDLEQHFTEGARLEQQIRDNLVSSSGISDYHHEAKARAPGVITGRYGTIGEVFYIEEEALKLLEPFKLRTLSA